jgi:IS30 family transposase
MPRRRKRRPDALTFRERKVIAKGLAWKLSIREIARRLSRSPSTVSREVQRNSWRRGYDPHRGEKASRRRACRPKPCKLTLNPRLRAAVANGLFADWSPEQISGWLCRAYPNCDAMRVSHETIYKRLYMRTNEALGRDHLARLRCGQRIRRCRQKTRKDAGSIVP